MGAHAAVITANVMFGISYSSAKLLTTQFMGPYALNVSRILVSIPLFWMLLLFKPANPGIRKEHIGRFLLCGLAGVTINQLFFIKGVSLTSTIHASLLALGTPIFITAAAAWLLKENMTRNKLMGLVMGLGGAALLMSRAKGGKAGDNLLLGDILIVINSISYALYFVWAKPLMRSYNPIHVIRWVFMFGGLLILPIGWSDFTQTNFAAFTPLAWAALAAVVLGATFIAYLCNIIGLRYLGPTITGTYIYSQPVFATVIAILFLGETFHWYHAAAAILVFGGVWLVNRPQR